MVPNRAKYLNVSFSLSTDQIKTKFTMMVSQQETYCSNEKVERQNNNKNCLILLLMDTLKLTYRKISKDGYSTLNVMKKHKGMHHIKHRVVS